MIKLQFGKTPKRDLSKPFSGTSVTWEEIKKTEEKLLMYYESLISNGTNEGSFRIEHRSQEYTTLFYIGPYWIARLKWTPSAKWLKLCCVNGDQTFSLHSEADIYSHIDLSKEFIAYIDDLESRRKKKIN